MKTGIVFRNIVQGEIRLNPHPDPILTLSWPYPDPDPHPKFVKIQNNSLNLRA